VTLIDGLVDRGARALGSAVFVAGNVVGCGVTLAAGLMTGAQDLLLALTTALSVTAWLLSLLLLNRQIKLEAQSAKEAAAEQAKLDQVIKALPQAPDVLIRAEQRTPEEIEALRP
jgi:low affinity Fe/Cu permease